MGLGGSWWQGQSPVPHLFQCVAQEILRCATSRLSGLCAARTSLIACAQPQRKLLRSGTTGLLQISCFVAHHSHAHVRASLTALLAHLQGHTLIYILGKASCYSPTPCSLPHIRTGTHTRLPCRVPIDGQVCKSSQRLQSHLEHGWNQITAACPSPCRNPEGSAANHSAARGASGTASSFNSSFGDGLPRQAAFPLLPSGPRRPFCLPCGQHAAMNEQHSLSGSGWETRASSSPDGHAAHGRTGSSSADAPQGWL